jgi:hypothetical protein
MHALFNWAIALSDVRTLFFDSSLIALHSFSFAQKIKDHSSLLSVRSIHKSDVPSSGIKCLYLRSSHLSESLKSEAKRNQSQRKEKTALMRQLCLSFSSLCCLWKCLSNSNLCCRNLSGTHYTAACAASGSVCRAATCGLWKCLSNNNINLDISVKYQHPMCCLWKCLSLKHSMPPLDVSVLQ